MAHFTIESRVSRARVQTATVAGVVLFFASCTDTPEKCRGNLACDTYKLKYEYRTL